MVGAALALELTKLKSDRTSLKAQHREQASKVKNEISRLQAELARLDAEFEQQDAASDEKHQSLFLNFLLAPPAAPTTAEPEDPQNGAVKSSQQQSGLQASGAAVRTHISDGLHRSTEAELPTNEPFPGSCYMGDMDEGMGFQQPATIPIADWPQAEPLHSQPQASAGPDHIDQQAQMQESPSHAGASAQARCAQDPANVADHAPRLPEAVSHAALLAPAMYHYTLPVAPSAARASSSHSANQN